MSEKIYRNINSKDLIEYDSKLKTYINNKIETATSYYKQAALDATAKVDTLTNTVNDLTSQLEKALSRLDELDSGNSDFKSDIIIDAPIDNSNDGNDDNNTPIVTPMLRSVPMVRSISPEVIEVDEDIEEHFVVYDRIISPYNQATYNNIIVTTDDRSNRIWFSMWKTFDNRELIEKTIKVIWINAEGMKGESICESKTISGDRLYFAWNIPSSVTVKAGTIQFALRITDTDYAWHTLPAEIQCVQGLMDGDWEDIPEAVASVTWADYIEDQWNQILVICYKQEYDAIVDKGRIVYVVEQPDGSVKMYLGTTEISTSGGSGREFQICYDSNTRYIKYKYSDESQWTNLVQVTEVVSLTSQEYQDLQDAHQINPAVLYVLKD